MISSLTVDGSSKALMINGSYKSVPALIKGDRIVNCQGKPATVLAPTQRLAKTKSTTFVISPVWYKPIHICSQEGSSNNAINDLKAMAGLIQWESYRSDSLNPYYEGFLYATYLLNGYHDTIYHRYVLLFHHHEHYIQTHTFLKHMYPRITLSNSENVHIQRIFIRDTDVHIPSSMYPNKTFYSGVMSAMNFVNEHTNIEKVLELHAILGLHHSTCINMPSLPILHASKYMYNIRVHTLDTTTRGCVFDNVIIPFQPTLSM